MGANEPRSGARRCLQLMGSPNLKVDCLEPRHVGLKRGADQLHRRDESDLQPVRKIRFDRHSGRLRMGILFKLRGKQKTQLGVECFGLSSTRKQSWGTNSPHGLKGVVMKSPVAHACGGYKTMARLSVPMALIQLLA